MRNGLACILAGALALALPLTGALAQSRTGTVKIGLNESLSGAFQPVGVPPAAAVRMAVKEINDKGGFAIGGTTYKLTLAESDNQSTPASALAGITKLVEDEKVKFIFGPTQSALAIQTAEVTAPADVIQFSAASLWQSRGLLSDPSKPLLFGTQNSVVAINKFDIAGMKELGAKKVVMITQDDDTSKSIFPRFIPDMKEAGIDLSMVLFPTNAADLTPYIIRAKGEKPDLIFYFFPQARTAEVLRTTLDLDAAPRFGGRAISPNAAMSQAIGKPVPIPFFTTFATPSFDYPPNGKVQDFRDRLIAFDPNVAGPVASFAFFSYDFVFMLVEAMKKAGTVDDTAKVASALKDLTYEGVIGRICFDKEMRTTVNDGGLIFVRDGKVDSRTIPSPCP